MSEAGRKAILRLVETTPDISGPNARKRGGPPPAGGGDDDGVDMGVVEQCAKYELNDTGNGKRLVAHFGADLAFIARASESGGDPIAWTGKFWDHENGKAIALSLAQRLGKRIALEADFLSASKDEVETIAAAEALPADDKSEAANAMRKAAANAQDRLSKSKRKRRDFAVTTGNGGRIEKALQMAGPALRRPASAFNANPYLIVTQTHTLRFVVEPDLECEPGIDRKRARVDYVAEFNRADYVTGLVPCAYDPDAKAAKWERFLGETMRDLDLRRTVQAYSGTGLLGALAQKVMYHYGLGANGKSVFLAVISAVLGPSLAVGLPKESVMGKTERGSGQATPDLVRLFGKRMLQVDEMSDGEPLREDFIKRLVGGDKMVVRGLNAGYFEMINVATPHLTGNGRPRIDGTDDGIWRRMCVVHWSYTVPPEQRRDFAELVEDLLTERSGILNWLINGALDFLANGLYEAPAAKMATDEYHAEMDPIGEFLAQCIETAPGESIQAGRMYDAFCAWARASGRNPLSATRVGRRLGEVLKREKRMAANCYVNVRFTPDAIDLINSAPPPAEPEDYR